MDGVACNKCVWFGTREKETSARSIYVAKNASEKAWDFTKKSNTLRDGFSGAQPPIRTCQHPTCFVIRDYGKSYDPETGISDSFEIERVSGHVLKNSMCNCSLFKKRKWYQMSDMSTSDHQLKRKLLDVKVYNECVAIVDAWTSQAHAI